MAATPSPRTEAATGSLRAALVFQAVQLNEPLKAALAGAGVEVVYESKADGIDRGSLKDARPQVFVVNLDPDLEDHLDDLTELLDEYDRPVIFNDAAASNSLSGWDQARWARHLAAKIRGEVDAHPPRPAGATLIPSPKPAPPAARPAAVASAPVTAAPVAAAPVAAALAPPAPAPSPAPAAVAAAAPAVTPVLKVAARPPEAAAVLKAAEPAPPAPAPAEAALDDLFADLLSAAPAPAAPKPLAPTVEIPVVPPRETARPSVETDGAIGGFDLDLDLPTTSAEPDSTERPVVAVDNDFGDFGEFLSADTGGAAPASTTLASWDEFEEPGPVTGAAGSVDPFDAGLDEAFADFDLPAAPARATEELTDLDALFREMQPAPEPAKPAAAPTTAGRGAASTAPAAEKAAAGTTRKATELKPPPMDWSLEPLDGEGLATDPTPTPTGRAQYALGADAKSVVPPPVAPPPVSKAPAPAADVGDTDLAGFDFFFDDASAPAPAASGSPAPAAPGKMNLDEIPDFGFSLDPIEEPPAAPTAPVAVNPPPARAVAATPARPAPVAAAPAARAVPAKPVPAAPEPAGFDFDFDNFNAPAPSSGRAESRGLEAAALADLDGLFADIEAPPVVADIPNLDRIWILGASIGGPEAVRAFLAGLKKSLPSAFILAQHMGAEFLDLMISQLAKASPLPVKVARDGERLQNGDVLVAPVGKRLTLDAQGRVQLGELPNDTAYSPSIDQIMFDMADRFGPRCSAIIFSGMASDAIEGAKYIHAKGGRVWVQDPSTCVISSMIDGAQAAGVVNYVGSPEQLAEHLQAHLA